MVPTNAGEFAADYDYPVTTEELIEDQGDRTIELPNGSETVGDVLARLESETFETADDVRLALSCAVSNKAVGRIGYSDRDPAPVGSPYTPDAVSF
ncbi:DUF5789 family protein [Natronorubrum daqingense]|uniref:DUF2795 domain-containing protein n=1 Tax=Natronorubrum daqingense TaxID=588898 RepID=A0A1N7EMH5_9EURY|nr:DUF2795 domain-containing protein [Natronorubrum daqingense]APX97857.1 DUF2795 domain-containing protein [Natronorubrum daqingense]SIR89270.1 hypothetical protein SAMN05421809_2708 [Natronorubrum daqingense]